MRLTIQGIDDGGTIPPRFAFGVPDAEDHVRLGNNLNPAVSWADVPEGTKSLVLICVDTDVPTKPDDVNQDGRIVPADLPRADFYHWVMVDIPADCTGVAEGECSREVTAGGNYSSAIGTNRSNGDGIWKITSTSPNSGILELKFRYFMFKKQDIPPNKNIPIL